VDSETDLLARPRVGEHLDMVCRLRAMSASSHWRRIDAALIAFACVGFAVPAWGQDAAGAAPSLSAVCIGRVTQEQRTTVAVHWSGADPVEIWMVMVRPTTMNLCSQPAVSP